MILLLISLFCGIHCENWAVVVAGSFGDNNYRHQSDVYHAFQILKNTGFDDDHLIVMAYDDIATIKKNRYKGRIFNNPTGVNVYPGSRYIHYKGKSVSAQRFLDVLSGNETAAGGKVVKSTEKDNIFVFFSDHGSNKRLTFPGGGLYANDLFETLKSMHEKKQYNKILFYIEACYSGSMFQDILPDNWNIFAVTAANPTESSWASYCGAEEYDQMCLGDEMACSWMEDLEAEGTLEGLNTKLGQPVKRQTAVMVEKTTLSHVQMYGQKDIQDMMLGEFLTQNWKKKANTEESDEVMPDTPDRSAARKDAESDIGRRTNLSQFPFLSSTILASHRPVRQNPPHTHFKPIDSPSFETVPQALGYLAHLHSLAESNSPHAADARADLKDEYKKIGRAEQRTERLVQSIVAHNQHNMHRFAHNMTTESLSWKLVKENGINWAGMKKWKNAVTTFEEICGDFDDYSLNPQLRVIGNAVRLGLLEDNEAARQWWRREVRTICR
ncbi:putative Vacuolar-processing enzyme beta-isozyme 1 [Blattamonas nauphoetae]|uniref:Vacuolar-processing enzyme beta-isozyme 1 n=1 Tax=Blattamonas nauphoetae TaxID=2049346 RepID=A0ABQ9YM01_9EUKA|nr:putative Vacuolar-processing enzyme beta-isozyme 1 [Blattamonas nauphoetae]